MACLTPREPDAHPERATPGSRCFRLQDFRGLIFLWPSGWLFLAIMTLAFEPSRSAKGSNAVAAL